MKKIIVILLLLVCISSASAELMLSVALYPYVPDIKIFKTAVQSVWENLHPDVKLNFISWDCYSDDPPENLDVFVFDAIFLHDFVDFNLFSLSSGDNIPVFYADFAGVNANINEDKRFLAIELLNVITGKDVLIKAVAPQYLLTARKSVYDFLSKSDPVYAKLKSIAAIENSHIFMLRPGGRIFLKNAEAIIEKLKGEL